MTARRDLAEKEFLEKHQEAGSQTQKYLDEAQVQLADLIRQTDTKRQQASTLDSTSKASAKKTRDDAAANARDVLGNAEARAAAIMDDAEKRSSQLVSEAEERLAKIMLERDTVAGYLENLRGVLQQAEKMSAT